MITYLYQSSVYPIQRHLSLSPKKDSQNSIYNYMQFMKTRSLYVKIGQTWEKFLAKIFRIKLYFAEVLFPKKFYSCFAAQFPKYSASLLIFVTKELTLVHHNLGCFLQSYPPC